MIRKFLSKALWLLIPIGYVFYVLLHWYWAGQNQLCIELYRKHKREESFQSFLEQKKSCGSFLGVFDAHSLKRSLETAGQLATKEKDNLWATKFYDLCLQLKQERKVDVTDFNLIEYATAFASSGNYERARGLLEPELKNAPNDLTIVRGMAEVELAAGHLEEAKKQITLALDLEKNQKAKKGYFQLEDRMHTSETAAEIYESTRELSQAEKFRHRVCELAQEDKDWDLAILSQEDLVSYFERTKQPYKALEAQKAMSDLEKKQKEQEDEEASNHDSSDDY